MPLFNLPDFWNTLAPGARVLGLDLGSVRIGVALSDVNRRLASPYGVIARGRLRQNAAEILAIAAKEKAGGLVVGLPLDEDQRIGRAAQACRDWAHAISAATGLPAAMHDESLTTAEAHQRLIAAGVSRAGRQQIIDKVAAAAILQGALDLGQKNGG